MADDQPLTCVRCWHAPASRLLVIRWREETLRLLCTDCAAKGEAEAPGLPGFRGLTVLTVGPVREGEAVTEWAIRHPNLITGKDCTHNHGASGGEGLVRGIFPAFRRNYGDEAAIMSRQVTPWKPVPGEGEGNAPRGDTP